MEEQAKSERKQIRPWLQKVIKVGKYMAAGLLGLVAGKIVSGQVSRYHEYRADAFSKELLDGNSHHLIEALQQIEKDTLDLVKREGLGDIPKWKLIVHALFPSHPSIEKRAAALSR